MKESELHAYRRRAKYNEIFNVAIDHASAEIRPYQVDAVYTGTQNRETDGINIRLNDAFVRIVIEDDGEIVFHSNGNGPILERISRTYFESITHEGIVNAAFNALDKLSATTSII